MNWFGESFRKVHIIYVSPEWAARRGEQFDARRWVELFQAARIESVELYAKDHHGICYYQSTLGLPYPRDVLGELLEQTRAAGIKLMAYFSVGYDAYALGVHSEWQTMSAEGRPFQYRPFFHACLNTPYREYALRQIEEIVRQYPVDGLWLDIVSFAYPAPEHAGRHLLAPCYCISCRRKYRERFGRPAPLHPSLVQAREAYRWEAENVRSFLDEAYHVARSYRPDLVIAYNGAGNPADPIDSADLTSIESHGPDYLGQSFTARWSRSRGKPFEVLTPTAPSGWCTWDEKPVNDLTLESAVVLAQGGSPVFGVVPYLDGGIDPAHIEGIGQVFRRVEAIEDYVRGATSVAQIALLLGTKPLDAPHLWAAGSAGAQSWSAALIAGHFLYDVVATVADAAHYPVVVVPDAIPLNAADVRALTDYVSSGGKLLVCGRSGLLDGNGAAGDEFALTEVLGIHFRANSEHVFAYLRATDSSISQRIPQLPLLVEQRPVEVELAGAVALATLNLPETAYSDATTYLWGAPPPAPGIALPGITLHRFGAGLATYVAVPLDTRGYKNVLARQLAINLVASLLGARWLETDAPSSVEVVLNRLGNGHVLHLVDHRVGDPTYGLPESGRTAGGIRVTVDRRQVPMTRATLVPTGESVAIESTNTSATLTLPSFDVHVVVALQS